jgi:hypothetical protein
MVETCHNHRSVIFDAIPNAIWERVDIDPSYILNQWRIQSWVFGYFVDRFTDPDNKPQAETRFLGFVPVFRFSDVGFCYRSKANRMRQGLGLCCRSLAFTSGHGRADPLSRSYVANRSRITLSISAVTNGFRTFGRVGLSLVLLTPLDYAAVSRSATLRVGAVGARAALPGRRFSRAGQAKK